MEQKIILIGGGVVGVAFVGFIIAKSRAQSAAQQENASQAMPDTAYYGSMSPISGGISSDLAGGGGAISDPANSGSSSMGGGFDLMAVMSSMFKDQAANQALQIRTGGNVAESAILAGIDFGSYGGTASVNHTLNGTVLSITPGGDPFDKLVEAAYQETLGRKADLGGATFFKNSLMNGNVSYNGVLNSIRNSAEYQGSQPQPNYTDYKSTSYHVDNGVDPTTGLGSGTMGGSSA